MGNKKKKNRPQPSIERKRQRYDEHALCKTPNCHNVVAVWARGQGTEHGYCTACRRSK